MKALDKLKEISEDLFSWGIEAAEKEAELIIRYGLNISLADLYKDNPSLNAGQIYVIEKMAGRRRKREPLQYILGSVDFLGLTINVGHGVLIPRPETELMAEYAIKKRERAKTRKGENEKEKQTTILDLCTGSGCIALALANAFPEALVYGIDISDAAINYAVKNAEINKLTNVKFIKGYLFEPLGDDRTFDMIISNPPYIKTEDMAALQPEIKDWEPLGALDGGGDGLAFYRAIIPAARKFLKDNGILMLELGAGCSDDAAGMMKNAGYARITVHRDYAGIERIAEAEWTR